MRNVGQMLIELARQYHVRLDILEKDYALSYLLVAIVKTPNIGDQIVLKGGTALRKLYYPGYRFSEDLDYSTVQIGPLADYDQAMDLAIHQMTELLLKYGPFALQLEPLMLPQPHPGQQAAYFVRIQFPNHHQPLCRLKVEITTDEPILLPISNRQIIHDYDELLVEMVNVYDLREIVAEKLRTLLQVRKKYDERGWIASRICRDYYDLWSILQKEGNLDGQIPELLTQKCKIRQVTFNGPTDFTPSVLFEEARKQWQQQLLPFVPNAPHAEKVLSEVQPLISALWD